jgi:hypothetical protein
MLISGGMGEIPNCSIAFRREDLIVSLIMKLPSTLEFLSYGPVEVNACHLSINLTIYVLKEKYLAFSNVPICPIA